MIVATDKGVIKGDISWRPKPDERLLLEGERSAYQGRPEFKFKSARAYVPVSSKDQLVYICETTLGFGKSMETKIWDTWGELWMDKLEPGIIKTLNGEKYHRLLDSIDEFARKKEESETVTWLMGHGATVNMAQAAWTAWNKQAVGIVKSDCYRLVDLPHYGFANVDNSMRHAFQIGDTDPRRIKAAVLYAMKQQTDDGSTIVNWMPLRNAALDIIGGTHLQILSDCIREMFEEGVLIPFKATMDLATFRDFEHATTIWEFVR